MYRKIQYNPLPRGPEPQTKAETEALQAVGIALDADIPNATPLAQTAANHAELVATALPLAEAAVKLGVTDGRLADPALRRPLLSAAATIS